MKKQKVMSNAASIVSKLESSSMVSNRDTRKVSLTRIYVFSVLIFLGLILSLAGALFGVVLLFGIFFVPVAIMLFIMGVYCAFLEGNLFFIINDTLEELSFNKCMNKMGVSLSHDERKKMWSMVGGESISVGGINIKMFDEAYIMTKDPLYDFNEAFLAALTVKNKGIIPKEFSKSNLIESDPSVEIDLDNFGVSLSRYKFTKMIESGNLKELHEKALDHKLRGENYLKMINSI